MRRSICYTEPTSSLAGTTSTWKFIYTTANHLPKGTKVRFDLESKGRPIDWQIPQTDLKAKSNVIWMEVSGEKKIAGELTFHPETQGACFEFTLPIEMKSGESFFIWMGSMDKDPSKGTMCQKNTQRKRAFSIFIDPKGKGDYKDPDLFHIDVRGNQLKNLKILAPSMVSRNKRFDVIVRFEDCYGNLTSNAPEGTLIDLSYQHLRENLSWKLFVPETGFIALPNLYFNEPGIYKIQLRNTLTNEIFYSPPIKCLPEGSPNLYWGLFHGESEKYDATDSIETLLRHMRDDRGLQFYATSCFDSESETSSDQWKAISQQITEFNEDERFVAFLGFQWLGEKASEGLRQFIYTKDAKPILRKADTKSNSLKKIYKTSNPKEMIAIPSFTMGNSTLYDFQDFNPEFEKVVEIYNAWGSSELSKKEGGNLRPIEGSGKGTISEAQEGSIVKALNKGYRFGFVAGGLDDRGPYEGLYDTSQKQYSPGLTAILAKEHNRSSLIEALNNRSCYATTGEKIVIGLSIASFPMGSEIDTKSRPGLEYNRHITGFCIGTQDLLEVILMRAGKPWKKIDVQGSNCEFEVDDSDPLSQIALQPEVDRSMFTYYYLKVVQKDGHIAWSSPIWIDLNGKTTAAPAKKSRKRTESGSSDNS